MVLFNQLIDNFLYVYLEAVLPSIFTTVEYCREMKLFLDCLAQIFRKKSQCVSTDTNKLEITFSDQTHNF